MVSGAASGIGAALAGVLAERGCHLALADRDAEGLARTAKEAQGKGVRVSQHVFDIAASHAIEELPGHVLKAHPRVSVLINNAGVALAGTFEEVTLDDFGWLFEINFWSVVRMMKAFLPLLKREAAAQIVNVSSVFGLVGPPGQCAYSASKFAIRGVSEVVRHELHLEASGVGISAVYPAGVRTNIALNARIAAGVDREALRRDAGQFDKLLRIPPRRAAETIVRGLERREARILVGRDAVLLDTMQRLLPANYFGLFKRLLERK